MDWKLELVTIPVSDVDRAKAFYVEQAGFVADHDHVVNDAMRFVQLTPRGSACSIAIGTGLTDLTPGSAQVQLVVADIATARDELHSRGVDVSEVADVRLGLIRLLRRPGREPLGGAATATEGLSRAERAASAAASRPGWRGCRAACVIAPARVADGQLVHPRRLPEPEVGAGVLGGEIAAAGVHLLHEPAPVWAARP